MKPAGLKTTFPTNSADHQSGLGLLVAQSDPAPVCWALDAFGRHWKKGVTLSVRRFSHFDRGFITFADDGELLISPVADGELLERMGIPSDHHLQAGSFNTDQRHFLRYHRDEIFLKAAL